MTDSRLIVSLQILLPENVACNQLEPEDSIARGAGPASVEIGRTRLLDTLAFLGGAAGKAVKATQEMMSSLRTSQGHSTGQASALDSTKSCDEVLEYSVHESEKQAACQLVRANVSFLILYDRYRFDVLAISACTGSDDA